ncbi:chromosome partitioning protein ParB [Streptomyces sp. CB02959]|uniref:class I SAM-dependent methyltransferase n=1 Tax=Streptomyces sp. CB02959 TaxID=2020330 RepID=UPI000C276986|nr:class I SAM-dependent methyltransferase [Streptomyces sp. CB02959]PJN40737.1 chromosome partitioning protein ParB [Streptomyces sp. CB02959]
MPTSSPGLFDDAPMPPTTLGPLPGIQPFSVIRTDLGPWRERRRAWHDLGITSRAGREHVTTYASRGKFAQEKLTEINGGLSTFDPVLAETSYRWYCPEGGNVLDPFAGGSVRGLVAGNGGYRYTGIDLSPVQLDANEEQAAAWRENDLLAAQPEWLLGDAADVLPELEEGAYDYVFTCPPYHNLEKYSDHPADLSAMRWKEFAQAYQEIIAASVRCLAEDRFATWVVGEVRNSLGMIRGLIPLTISAHEAAGASLYNDAVLMNTLGTVPLRIGNQWRASRKIGRHHQYVLTFVKGDPKSATAHITEAAS